jgi:hypothetical protein
MRHRFILLGLLWALSAAAPAQVNVGIGIALPGVNIGINLPAYPQLVRVPSYPVYYAPSVASNFFFYDGMYWVYERDNWYASSWYNGPWSAVGPGAVPVYLLRVPVRYFRAPPTYFRGWARKRRHAGVSTGAPPGNRNTAAGTAGTAATRLHRRRCPTTSASFRATVILRPSSSRPCAARTTATSRVRPWCGSTTSKGGSKGTSSSEGKVRRRARIAAGAAAGTMIQGRDVAGNQERTT